MTAVQQMAYNQYRPNTFAEDFDISNSAMFIDEVHKVFQFIDKDSKGFLPVDSVLAMYNDIAVKVQARSTKADANLIIAALITNATSTEENSAITWEAFRETITQWVLAYGADFIQTVADQEGFLTKTDCQCLYKYIQAFFVQGDVEKRNELL